MANYVPNQMPSQLTPDGTRMAFVGEAPASEEMKQGRPFVGSAGRELERWFQTCGISRGQCFIGNLSQERAPDDKLEKMFEDSKCHKPSPRLQKWIDTLKDELQALNPTVVVALGRHPLYILTGKDGIFKRWGSILPCTLVPGLKVIPIPHPSAIIRVLFALRPIMVTFLKRAVQESKTREPGIIEREYLLNPPFEEVLHHLDRLRESPAISFDIERPKLRSEGGKTYITHISFSDSPFWAMPFPLSCTYNTGGTLRLRQRFSEPSPACSAHRPCKIGHNLMFDFLCLTDEWKLTISPPIIAP